MNKDANESAKPYRSEALDKFLSLRTPEGFARTKNRMTLAVKIQDAMVAKGIGKKQFADLIHQHPSVITKWLSGTHNFTVDTLTDIERVLDVQLLALEEKTPVVYIVHRTTVNSELSSNKQTFNVDLRGLQRSIKGELALTQTYDSLFPGGQAFSNVLTQENKTKTSRENLKRRYA